VDWAGDVLQAAIFDAAKQSDLPPSEAFKLLYELLIGKEAGPKLGPFLASLEPDFVSGRISAFV
jgi:lysyl-tRNA synthetase class 1